jgi:transcriptional regulator with XRE-family HTH domain
VKKTIHTAAQRVFCDMLRAERKRSKLTQTDLAQRLARPQSFVAKVERGERRLDVIEFLRYARSMEFNPADFLKRFQRSRALEE